MSGKQGPKPEHVQPRPRERDNLPLIQGKAERLAAAGWEAALTAHDVSRLRARAEKLREPHMPELPALHDGDPHSDADRLARWCRRALVHDPNKDAAPYRTLVPITRPDLAAQLVGLAPGGLSPKEQPTEAGAVSQIKRAARAEGVQLESGRYTPNAAAKIVQRIASTGRTRLRDAAMAWLRERERITNKLGELRR